MKRREEKRREEKGREERSEEKRREEKERKGKESREKTREDYAFRRQFNEKPRAIPGCPRTILLTLGQLHVQPY